MSDHTKEGNHQAQPSSLDELTHAPLTRRSFLKAGIAATAFSASGALVLSPLARLDQPLSADEFLQQHYERLTPPQMEEVLARIEREIKTGLSR